jgi:hypothetical protein
MQLGAWRLIRVSLPGARSILISVFKPSMISSYPVLLGFTDGKRVRSVWGRNFAAENRSIKS